MALALTLDDITFADFEIPERFGPLGGEQMVARHNFPGGIRTIQKFGGFPPEAVSWSGYLTGATAFDRQQQLDRKRASGATVTLRYGRYAWQGIVTRFHATPGHQFLVPYQITFDPIADVSGASTVPQGAQSSEAKLAQQQSNLTSATDPNSQVQPLPPMMQVSVAQINADIAQSVKDGGGVVAKIPPQDQTQLQTDSAAVSTAAAPAIAGTDATQASPALDVSAYATAATNVATLPKPAQVTTVTINPDMMALAQQYLGDATRWQEITALNNLPPDPMPQGQFTLLIPQK
jgi:hypothetical protein